MFDIWYCTCLYSMFIPGNNLWSNYSAISLIKSFITNRLGHSKLQFCNLFISFQVKSWILLPYNLAPMETSPSFSPPDIFCGLFSLSETRLLVLSYFFVRFAFGHVEIYCLTQLYRLSLLDDIKCFAVALESPQHNNYHHTQRLENPLDSSAQLHCEIS